MGTFIWKACGFDNGRVTVEVDINDVNWKVARVRCSNGSAQPAAAVIFKAGVEVFSVIAPAAVGATPTVTSWNINNVQLSWQAPYYNDITGQMEAAGIELADYVVQARWPA